MAAVRAFARVTSSQLGVTVHLLRDVLTNHTQTNACWFALWDGWPAADAWMGAPTFHLPHRDYLLFHGSLGADLMAIAGDDRGPSLWWPARRNCTTAASRQWRNHVDVDVVGEVDTGEEPMRGATVFCHIT